MDNERNNPITNAYTDTDTPNNIITTITTPTTSSSTTTTNASSPTIQNENAFKGTGLESSAEEKPLYTSGTSEMPA
ncbi:hypothetical protein [Dendrosporobacter sp. 1207_IL3150]|uniref:hypothetical protein n=1 Tax=Dendrosporobacter sp. 1207_IL3150 TaxID=3084054 RepID=UPI002FDA2E4D